MILVLFFVLPGCDPSSEEACTTAAAEPQALTVGTGETEFIPLQDGDSVGLAYGSQGGIHIWGSLRVSGIVQGISDSLADPDNPMVSYVIKDGDTEIAGFHEIPHHFTVKADGTWEFLADRLVLYTYDTSSLSGTPLVMQATLLDACGTELSAEAEIEILVEEGP